LAATVKGVGQRKSLAKRRESCRISGKRGDLSRSLEIRSSGEGRPKFLLMELRPFDDQSQRPGR
jgi:hypothetical protein